MKTRDGETLTLEDEKLINFCRELKFGEFTVKVRNGIPCLIEKAIQQIRLD